MGRRRKGIDNLDETLSMENSKIQEELLKDIVDNQENMDEPSSNENNDLNNLSNENEIENMDNLVNTEISIGSKVRVKKDVAMDCFGKKIHAGVKNYSYTVKNIRPDKIACIECLTHVFNVKVNDLEIF